MIRRPPRSTLFPYTTSSDLSLRDHHYPVRPEAEEDRLTEASQARSEEHTSELQSPCNLVCRLLLEKKNQSTDVKDKTTALLVLIFVVIVLLHHERIQLVSLS